MARDKKATIQLINVAYNRIRSAISATIDCCIYTYVLRIYEEKTQIQRTKQENGAWRIEHQEHKMKMELTNLQINHHIECNKLSVSRKYNANIKKYERQNKQIQNCIWKVITMATLYNVCLPMKGKNQAYDRSNERTNEGRNLQSQPPNCALFLLITKMIAYIVIQSNHVHACLCTVWIDAVEEIIIWCRYKSFRRSMVRELVQCTVL